MEKNQQQQQVEKDAQRTVNLAEARMSAGILPGSRVSMAGCLRFRSALPRCVCAASGWMPAFS